MSQRGSTRMEMRRAEPAASATAQAAARGRRRRQAVLDTAARVFSEASYRGATTAEIAREAGSASRSSTGTSARSATCTSRARGGLGAALRELGAGARRSPDTCALEAIAEAHVSVRSAKLQLADLWIQALNEASEDPGVAEALRRQMRDVHDFFADVIRRGQAQGAISPTATRTRRRGSCSPAASSAWSGRRVGLLDARLDPPPHRRLPGEATSSASARATAPRKHAVGCTRSERSAPFRSRQEKAPAAAPGPSSVRWGAPRGVSGSGSAAQPPPVVSPVSALPCTSAWRPARLQGALTLGAVSRRLSSSSVK